MPQPVPPPPPPKQGVSTFTLILVLALIVVGVAWYRGWLTVDRDPETSKLAVNAHKDKFLKDKDAAVKSVGTAYTTVKEKLSGKEAAAKTAKPEDKAAIDKEIADLKKKLDALEAEKKKAEAATDDAGLKGLDETVKKLLDSKDPPK